ncbi:MAG: Gfo/Idh/MocA family oxidoreductase [Candidatus Methylomirabilia bacterium]
MTDFNVALIGAGGIYRLAHGPAWRQMPRARAVVVCDTVTERAEQARRDLGAEASYTRLDELLEHHDIDVVDLCTPSEVSARSWPMEEQDLP